MSCAVVVSKFSQRQRTRGPLLIVAGILEAAHVNRSHTQVCSLAPVLDRARIVWVSYSRLRSFALRVSPCRPSLLRLLWRVIRSDPGDDAFACCGDHHWSLA